MTSKRKQWHIDNTYRALIEERDNWQWQFDTATEVIAELRAENDGLRAEVERYRTLWSDLLSIYNLEARR